MREVSQKVDWIVDSGESVECSFSGGLSFCSIGKYFCLVFGDTEEYFSWWFFGCLHLEVVITGCWYLSRRVKYSPSLVCVCLH